jgi:hypothetical protein
MTEKLYAIADSKVPTPNTPIEKTNNFLVSNLLNINAVAGIMIPIAKVYPLVNHCPVAAFTENSDIMAGKAVVNDVCSIELIIDPINSATNIAFLDFLSISIQASSLSKPKYKDVTVCMKHP